MTIKVFGHKNPDTDSVCGAIIASWFYTEILGQEAKPYRLGEINKETEYVLSTFGIEVPELLTNLSEDDQVLIVDTNNADELLDDLGKAEIVGIIDHHKFFGNISTPGAIDVTIRPIASTASVIFEEFLADYELPTHIAQLTCACIISDTLLFRSPTTTDTDKAILEELAHEHNINIPELADGMFAAKSDISHLAPEEIITYDAKQVNIGGKDLLVGVLETTAPASVLEHKQAIQEALQAKAQADDLDAALFFAIDILNEEATAITYDEASHHWVSTAFEAAITDDQAVLPGIVSRKKQIIPALEKIN